MNNPTSNTRFQSQSQLPQGQGHGQGQGQDPGQGTITTTTGMPMVYAVPVPASSGVYLQQLQQRALPPITGTACTPNVAYRPVGSTLPRLPHSHSASHSHYQHVNVNVTGPGPHSSPLARSSTSRSLSLSLTQLHALSQPQLTTAPPFPPPATPLPLSSFSHQSHVIPPSIPSHAIIPHNHLTKITDIERQLQSASTTAIQQAMLAVRNLLHGNVNANANARGAAVANDLIPSSPGVEFSQTQQPTVAIADSQSQSMSTTFNDDDSLSGSQPTTSSSNHPMSDLEAMILGLPAPPPPPPPPGPTPGPTIHSVLADLISTLTPHVPTTPGPPPPPPANASPASLATHLHSLLHAHLAYHSRLTSSRTADLAAAHAQAQAHQATLDAARTQWQGEKTQLAKELDALRDRAEGAEAEAIVVKDALAKLKHDAECHVEKVRSEEVAPARRRVKRLEDEVGRLMAQIEATEEEAQQDKAQLEKVRDQVEALEMDLGLERAEVEQERRESARLRGEVERANARADAAERAVATYQAHARAVDEARQQLEQQIGELRLEAEAQRAIAEHVRSQMKHEVDNAHAEARSRVAHVVAENERLVEAMARDQETLAALAADLDGARIEVAEITAELDATRAQGLGIEAAKTAAELDVQRVAEEAGQLRNELARLTGVYDADKQRWLAEKRKAEDAAKEMQGLLEQLRFQAQEAERTAADRTSTAEEVDRLQDELAVAQKTIENTEAEVTRLQHKQAELDHAKARASVAEARMADMQDQLAELESLRALADSRLVELNSVRARLNEADRAFMRVTVAEQVAGDLKRKLQSTSDEHRRDLEAVKKRMAALVDKAKRERDELKNQLEYTRRGADCRECHELRSRVNRLQRSLDSSTAAMDQLTPAVQVQMRELTAERDAAIAERKAVEAQMVQLRSEYDRVEADMKHVVDKAEANVTKVKQEMDGLRAELDAEREKMTGLEATVRHFEDVVVPDVVVLKQQLEKQRTRAQELEARLASAKPAADTPPTGPSTPSTHGRLRKPRPNGVSGRAALLASENDSGTMAVSSPSVTNVSTPPLRSIPAALRLLSNGPASSNVIDSPSITAMAVTVSAMHPPKKRKRTHNALDLLFPALGPPSGQQRRKVVVGFTGFKQYDPVYSFELRQRLAEIVLQLDGQVVPDTMHPDVTHVFCPPNATTIKYFSALVSCKWLMHDPAWIFDSHANGSLLSEFAYGVRATTPPLRGRRICGSPSFNDLEPEKKRPQMLREIVQLGSGTLVDSMSDAEIVLLAYGEHLEDKAGRQGYDWNEFMLWIASTVQRGERAGAVEASASGGDCMQSSHAVTNE